ncbi:hypothetical protein ACROYT_G043993 [Oculina patagonica]
MSFSSTYFPSLESNESTLQPTHPASAQLQPSRSSAELYLSLVSYALLVVIILFGNGLVVSAYVWNKRLRKAVTHTLIIGLASADFLVGLVTLPLWMYMSFSDHHDRKLNNHAYEFYITADIFIGSASILQLTGISIERSHAILRPFKHRQLQRKTFYIAVVSAWLFSAVLASLQPLQYGTAWQMPYTILTASVCFFIPVVVIISAYCSILVAAKTKGTLNEHQTHKGSLEREIRLSLTVALITLLFIMAWLPLFTITMLATFDPGVLPPSTTFFRLLHFVKWMHYSSSALNPFLYSYRNPDLRRTIVVLLRRIIFRGPGVDEVFRRRSSSLSTTRLRRLSSASDRSRKTSTESQQSTSRSRSGTVLSWISIRKQSSFSFGKKGKECTEILEGNNNIEKD